MPRLKSIIFYQNSRIIKLFLQKKNANFGALPADPQNTPHCEFLATRLFLYANV